MSEQIQGGLFDEKPTELSTADILGQSQTPEARYARNYRKNPENKKRINENRRKNRQMKKDQESRLSLVLESAASPITSKPQTIENTHDNSNAPSLSDLWSVTSWELNNSSQGYSQGGQRPVVRSVNTEQLSNEKIENQADLLLELRESFRGIHNELKLIREEKKSADESKKDPFAQGSVENKEQRSNEKNLRVDYFVNDASSSKDEELFIKSKPRRKLISLLLMSVVILTFLGFNTFFLVAEQTSLYESMSYSSAMAVMIAVLSEVSLLLLSVMASWTSNLEWKIGLMAGMVAMVVVMVGILDSSAATRVNSAAKQTQESKNIADEINTLKKLREPILARIEKLDPQHYRTEISRLSAQLSTPPNGYSYKIEQLSGKLATINTANADLSKMVWQRRAALMINLIVSAFLGSLWSRKSTSFIMKISHSIKNSCSNFCESV